jgi:RNA polymerase sigma-70 factor, ECF subfamily
MPLLSTPEGVQFRPGRRFPARCRAYAKMSPVTDDGLTLLARAAVNGDDRALAQLVRGTQDSVYRLCCYLASPSEAEDLTQETYLRMLQALPRFRFDAPARAWIFAIARHVCADHVRRRVRRAPLDRLVTTPGEAVLDLAHVELGELVDTLDPEKRTAFVLTQVLGLSYEEAATVCDCPVGTIRSRVARAREHLATTVRRADAS